MGDFEHYNLEHPNTPGQDWVSAPNTLRTDKDLIIKDLFNVNNVEVQMLRGQKFSRKSVSTLITGATYSVSASEYLIGVTSLSYAPLISLPRPSLVGAGKTYIVKDEAGGAATTTITISSAGEKTIDGAANTTLTANYQSKQFYTDGSNWFTV